MESNIILSLVLMFVCGMGFGVFFMMMDREKELGVVTNIKWAMFIPIIASGIVSVILIIS